MSAPVVYASPLQHLGVAKETQQGTPVAPVITIPVEEFSPDQTFEMIKDPAWRGHMAAASGMEQGPTKTDFSLKGPVFGDTIGHLLLNILGDLTTSGSEAPLVHAFSLLNSGQGQPPTHTFTHFQGPPASVGARRVPGACLSELGFKWNAENELATYDAKGMGWGTSLPPVAPVAAPSVVRPIAAWRARLGIGGPASGGTLVRNVMSAEISLKRALKTYYTVSGTQDPYVIARGLFELTGKMTFIAADESPLLAYLNNTQPSLQLVLGNGGAGAGLIELQFDIGRAAYTSSKFSAGNELAEYEVEWEGIATTTNAGASGGQSPCAILLTNGVTSY